MVDSAVSQADLHSWYGLLWALSCQVWTVKWTDSDVPALSVGWCKFREFSLLGQCKSFVYVAEL